MANNIASNLGETFQNIFLAGVGALSIGGEKAKEVIDDLVERGQVTVDEGRKMNEQLKHKAAEGASKVREESIRAYVRSLSPEERVAFAEQMAQIAREMEHADDDDVVVEAEDVADDGDVVVDAEGVYVGNDVNPVDHVDQNGDVVINAEGVYEGDDIDPVEHLKNDA